MAYNREQAHAALRGYGLLDTPNEDAFDRIVREVARELNVPIALISLLDEHRQWFKAQVGLQVSETPLSMSFCTHAVHGDEVMVVDDAQADARFSANPLVTGNPRVRFYAGATLRTKEGARIGTVCVLDDKPHDGLSDEHRDKLKRFAAATMRAIEARRQRHAAIIAGTPAGSASSAPRDQRVGTGSAPE